MKNKDIQLDVFIFRATGRTRTGDPRITNALLYQLSHNGNVSADIAEIECKSTAFLRNMQIFLRIWVNFCNFVGGKEKLVL